jgi:hypothetical protein
MATEIVILSTMRKQFHFYVVFLKLTKLEWTHSNYDTYQEHLRMLCLMKIQKWLQDQKLLQSNIPCALFVVDWKWV